ncbi:hypothetical protein BGZ73_003080 [Actinomortierella ambigua]|nr:hypothetical protein BGZ73_003080 [Actinomortierella ambigua]
MDQTTRDQEIVASLRAFLKHQSERVALYKEFNDAFKEYIAKRITPEEYTTICGVVTQGFVELSIEIQALEAHLGDGTTPNTTTASSTTSSSTTTAAVPPPPSSSSSARNLSLGSPEHAQLIRDVQILERTKLQLTIQGQKLLLAKEEQERQEAEEQRAQEQDERVVDEDSRVEEEASQDQEMEANVEATAVHTPNGGCHHHHHHHHGHSRETIARQPRASSGIVLDQRLTAEAWEEQLAENRSKLDQAVEEINDKLADINEAIAILIL